MGVRVELGWDDMSCSLKLVVVQLILGGAVNAVTEANSMLDAEVGYPAASSRLSWAVTSSRISFVVL